MLIDTPAALLRTLTAHSKGVFKLKPRVLFNRIEDNSEHPVDMQLQIPSDGIGSTWQRCKTLQQSGCGLTTTTVQTWPWAGSHPSSGWPWLHNVSTSATLAKGEDYPTLGLRLQASFANACHGWLV